jgi:hypothetical protein
MLLKSSRLAKIQSLINERKGIHPLVHKGVGSDLFQGLSTAQVWRRNRGCARCLNLDLWPW